MRSGRRLDDTAVADYSIYNSHLLEILCVCRFFYGVGGGPFGLLFVCWCLGARPGIVKLVKALSPIMAIFNFCNKVQY